MVVQLHRVKYFFGFSALFQVILNKGDSISAQRKSLTHKIPKMYQRNSGIFCFFKQNQVANARREAAVLHVRGETPPKLGEQVVRRVGAVHFVDSMDQT